METPTNSSTPNPSDSSSQPELIKPDSKPSEPASATGSDSSAAANPGESAPTPPAPDKPAADPAPAPSVPAADPAPAPATPAAPPTEPAPAPVTPPPATTPPAPPAPPTATAAAPSPGTQPRKGRRTIIMAVVAVGVVAALAAGGFGIWHYVQSRQKAATPPTVKVGVLMAFTGGSSSMGYGEMKGIQLAQKQLSADNIELVQMDSQCDATVAPDAMRRLVQQKVVAVIGDGCSSASVAALPIANDNKIPMVSPSASSPKLSIADDYFFRVVPPDNFQGAYLAQSVWNKGIKTVSIFYTDEPYGTAMNTVFTQKFTSLGGKVLTSVGATSDVIALQSQINTIKATKPQAVVFVANSVTSGAAAIKLARQAGMNVPFFGGDGLYDSNLVSYAGTAAEGLTITTFPTGSAAFKQSLLSAYGGEQLYAAAEAYDAFQAIDIAVKNGASTGEAIKNYLPKESFDGVTAHIKFDQNGEISDPSYKYALLTVKNGQFVAQ